jgi:predicted MFS family arabinose efflux permease
VISEFSLVAQRPARRHTQDMAWLTSAISVGTAAGSAAAGEVIDAVGGR